MPRQRNTRQARNNTGRIRRSRSPGRRNTYRLACPFNVNKNCSCQGSGFQNIARMNEHIKRAHGPVDAGRETTATGLQSAPGTFDRVSQDQWTRIGKLARDKDVKRKWEAIYQIIFPNDKPVTATYVPSAEQLQDYARSPPDWVIAEFKQVYGESQQEAIMSVNKFLTFYNIVRRGPLPHSTLSSRRIEQGQGSVATYSTGEPDASGMGEMEFFNPQGFVTVFSDDTFVGMAGMNVSYGLSQTLSTGHNILDEDECNEDMGTD